MQPDGLAYEIRQKTGMTIDSYCRIKGLSSTSLYRKYFTKKAIEKLTQDGIDVEKFMKKAS